MKKRRIIPKILGIAALTMLYGCSGEMKESNSDGLTKVTIKKGNGVSVYQIDGNSRIKTVNSTNDKTGVNESRSYTYGNANDLQMVKIDNSAYGTSYMYYQTATNRSDGKIATKTKTMANARGGSETYTMEYCYDDDGNLLGVIMRDDKGNIFAKGLEE